MRKIVLLVLVPLIFSGCVLKKERQQDQKAHLPNIVFIFVDDMGYGDLSCYGATDVVTPNIDRMAAEGILFTDFYSASSVCSPSRAGLLTGRYPQRMGVNGVYFPTSFTGMPPSEVTLAELLREGGYTSGIFGKWHLGHHFRYMPLQQGFDEYFGIPYSNDMQPLPYFRGNDVEKHSFNQEFMTRKLTEESIDFIRRNKGNPFFLYLPHPMPHVPLFVADTFKCTSEKGLYGDVIHEIDWSVGQIIGTLESLDLIENTLIIFSSDNGPWLVKGDHSGSAGILREGKFYTFDGGMRVPAVAMWKGKIPAGTVHHGMATHLDWFPTFANLADIKMPGDREIDGRDITSVLFQSGKRKGDSFLFFDEAELQAYRTGKWKIKRPYEGFRGASWKHAVPAHDTLLFDIISDPGETNNLYFENRSLADSLFLKMEKEYAAMGELPPSHVR
jgi:arylsulfatase A